MMATLAAMVDSQAGLSAGGNARHQMSWMACVRFMPLLYHILKLRISFENLSPFRFHVLELVPMANETLFESG